MKKRFFLILLFICLMAGCTANTSNQDSVDFAVLEQTAFVQITQTWEARPTKTFTPEPTDTEEPVLPIQRPTETPVTADEPEMITRGSDDEEADKMISRQVEAADVPTEVPPTAEPTATVYFPDHAQYISVLPSPNYFKANQKFYLTWEIKNTGTSTWSGKYKVYHSSGAPLADSETYQIDTPVEPGSVLKLSLPATAPENEGEFDTTWSIENPDGIVFYNVYYHFIVGDVTYITAVPD